MRESPGREGEPTEREREGGEGRRYSFSRNANERWKKGGREWARWSPSDERSRRRGKNYSPPWLEPLHGGQGRNERCKVIKANVHHLVGDLKARNFL